MHQKIFEDLYQIKPGKLSSCCYLIVSDKKLLIDSGTAEDFPVLEKELNKIGISSKEIDIIINTHEHFDHIGGNLFLQDTAIIMAHRASAVKIIYGDNEVTMCRANIQKITGYKVHVWLNNIDVIEVKNWLLKVLHTPGHTSGCICLYEPRRRILFSGDTLFAKGLISTIFKSGSLSEYLNSLRRLNTLKVDLLLPGHGKISNEVEKDIDDTINNVLKLFPEAKNLIRKFFLE